MTAKKEPTEGEHLGPSTMSLVRRARGPGRARITLCRDHHARLKRDEVSWRAAPFAGYQPLGRQLGETRLCPVCSAAVVRLVAFTRAVVDVLEHLATTPPASAAYVHSAALLVSWALENIPEDLGVTDELAAPSPPEQPTDAADSVGCGWRKFGLQLRERRVFAGLTRARLSQLSGVADSTIRNFETGRHRPQGFTVERIIAVPALRLRGVFGRFKYPWA